MYLLTELGQCNGWTVQKLKTETPQAQQLKADIHRCPAFIYTEGAVPGHLTLYPAQSDARDVELNWNRPLP